VLVQRALDSVSGVDINQRPVTGLGSRLLLS
jgi:hypothetical protein